ncbi:MAG: dihydrolipoyl dehydrogenase [Bdellovibrionaceae bacterium]|nr:dihydrolipoyl dehydrogenase [Pseudobdellovibrionaceae bacterium]
MQEFDLVVIGSGPGGYVGAIRSAQLGLKVAVVEKEKSLGGTCLNVGCIPSKALLESSEHYEFTKNEIKSHGVSCSNVKFDLKQMLNRKNQIVSELTQGIEFLFKKNKITKFQAWGKLKSPTEVQLKTETKTETIKAKNILLATGSYPIELPFAPFNKEEIISSTSALSFSKVPEKLIVIGGGYIGLELGSVWRRLGSAVIVIEAGDCLCSSMDKQVSEKFLSLLKKQGMQFHLQSKVTKVEVKNKKAKLFFEDSKGQSNTLDCDKVLVSVGRKAFTKKLGLENVKLKTNSFGQMEVDKNFRTAQKNIFAIGDLIPGPMLAHKAEEEGVAVAEFIATGYGHVNYETVPSVIYTFPEVASVGKTEEQLIDEKRDYLSGSFPFIANGRAKALNDTQGFVKILADKKTDKILGVHIIGPRAGDLIAEAVIAMEFHSSSEDLARSFHAHPTLSEVIREASLSVHKRARQI